MPNQNPAADSPRSGRDYITSGIAVAIIGGILGGIAASSDSAFGIIVFSVVGVAASLLFGIGVVAVGVEVGIKAARKT